MDRVKGLITYFACAAKFSDIIGLVPTVPRPTFVVSTRYGVIIRWIFDWEYILGASRHILGFYKRQ